MFVGLSIFPVDQDIAFLTSCFTPSNFAFALFAKSSASSFAPAYVCFTPSTKSLYEFFTESLISPDLSAIFRRVFDPLSGANKIPANAPTAAPAKKPTRIFELIIVLNVEKYFF